MGSRSAPTPGEVPTFGVILKYMTLWEGEGVGEGGGLGEACEGREVGEAGETQHVILMWNYLLRF